MRVMMTGMMRTLAAVTHQGRPDDGGSPGLAIAQPYVV
jgi:hypothetical protein